MKGDKSMASILDVLFEPFRQAIPTELAQGIDPLTLRVSPATNPSFGDYQFNGAMSLA
jgi:arginyl-tRNA synthetase